MVKWSPNKTKAKHLGLDLIFILDSFSNSNHFEGVNEIYITWSFN